MDTNDLIVLLEVISFDDRLNISLELIFKIAIEATIILIDDLRDFDQIFDLGTTNFGKSIVQVEEEKGEVESCLGCIPADLGSLLFSYWNLLLLSLIFEVELRQLSQHPENLPVELLFKISLNDVTKLELFAHESINLDVTKIWQHIVKLDPLGRIVDELFELCFHNFTDFWIKVYKVLENPDIVYKSTDSQNRGVSLLIHHISDVGHDQFWHEF